jgi:hypothetical protein
MLNQLRRLRLKRRSELISPLKDKEVNSLRYPGQSIQQMMDDDVLTWNSDLVSIIIVATIAGWSWFQYFVSEDSFVTALTASIMAVSVLAVMIPSLNFRLRKLRRCHEARNGERIVAEHLNQLIAEGYTVFHDVPCGFKKGKKMLFNIDHLLVGKKGIFAVETKTMRKVKGKKDELVFDGQQLLRFGKPLKHDPIAQAMRQAKWLHDELFEATDKRIDVTPVVTFPGWYIVRKTPPKQILVLSTPTADVFRSILAKREEKLTDEEVALVKHRIKMQIQDHRP